MNERVCIVGLGYVGLPLSIEFSKKKINVAGFDIDSRRIQELKEGIDHTEEVPPEKLKKALNDGIKFTDKEEDIRESDYVIVTVPTPITEDKQPDLTYVEKASEIVGRNLRRNMIVVYESTVYPGVTEEICQPILEKESGLKCPQDFGLGYSPERVNPGDKDHTIDKITKIVSGKDKKTTEKIDELYSKITKTYVAEDIKTAEAAKVIENIQRDLNIALVNELSMIFNKMNLDTIKVLEAAESKWNFHQYRPGLVGGHCIPVDPYYLVYKAKKIGHTPEVILAGRKINDHIPEHITNIIIEKLKKQNKKPSKTKILVAGLTFKENVKDLRTSQSKEIIETLNKKGFQIIGYEPLVEIKDLGFFEVEVIKDLQDISEIDVLLLTVPHNEIIEEVTTEKIGEIMVENSLILDVKGVLKQKEIEKLNIQYKKL